MGQHSYARRAVDRATIILESIDDAAAVYPDHDIITRHFEGRLTIGDFVSAFAEGSEGHGGLPTYLRITTHGDASKLRKLFGGKQYKGRRSKHTSH
jgi:hypothetical protein